MGGGRNPFNQLTGLMFPSGQDAGELKRWPVRGLHLIGANPPLPEA